MKRLRGQSSSRRREYREPSGRSFLKVLSGGLSSGADRESLCCCCCSGVPGVLGERGREGGRGRDNYILGEREGGGGGDGLGGRNRM